MNYQTGTQIALLLGHEGVDALFREHDLGPWRAAAVEYDQFPQRAIARRLAPHLDCSESAIEHVCSASVWRNPEFATRRAAWWVDRMRERTLEEQQSDPESPTKGEGKLGPESVRSHSRTVRKKRTG